MARNVRTVEFKPGLSRDAVLELVKSHFAYSQRSQLTQAANTLYRLAHTMEDG
jgi:hypothetical protein